MTTLTINTDRYALDLVRSGQVTKWEYDVLTLKLEIERLETLHNLKGEKRTLPPTVEFLIDFAAFLVVQGLEGCSIDTAYRVYSLVTVQFSQIAKDVAGQVVALTTKQ